MRIIFSSGILLISLGLTACGPAPQEPDPDGNVGMACTTNEDCQTPMSYLIRSSCPFTSLCLQNKCAVGCPIIGNDPTPGDLKGMACSDDGDCDCSRYAAGDMKQCSCTDKGCYAVVAE